MSEDTDQPAEAPEPEPPHRPRGGVAAIAIAVAIVALALAAWSTWQLRHARRADVTSDQQTAARLASIDARLAGQGKQTAATNQRLATLESNLAGLGAQLKGLGLRTSNLETAFATLNGRQQSAHDTVLLDDAEMLLRSGQQRFELFHDSGGALKAYAQAIAVLGQVQNPVYAAVRSSAITERDALAAAAPPARQSALDILSELRDEAATLPLAVAAAVDAKPTAKPGFWGRIGHAFSGIVHVSREHGPGNAPPADAHFARQTLALDLAQAQEALLAFDHAAFRRALQRSSKLLATQFDADNGVVKSARSQLESLLAQPAAAGAQPQLGGALAQLRNLRASQPAPPATAVPAPAASSGGDGT